MTTVPHPVRIRLVAWGLAFVAAWWGVLLAVGATLGADWPEGRGREDVATIALLVSTMIFTSFLALGRSRVLTALGIALIAFNSGFVVWFQLAIGGALWSGMKVGPNGVRTLELWLVAVCLVTCGLLVVTADPADAPPGRVVVRRVVVWIAAMALVAASVLATGRWL